MSNPLENLASAFERFPGIGPRQAKRFVLFLLAQSEGSRTYLADTIRDLGRMTASCPHCFRWFVRATPTDPDTQPCSICSSPRRDHAVLFVLEKDADIDNVERGGFRGVYFVLGGTVPLAEEHPEQFVRIRELLALVEQDGSRKALSEIILGLSATTEGDHSRHLLEELLRPLAAQFTIKISTLGRGLSTGSELEYADPDTIASALSARR